MASGYLTNAQDPFAPVNASPPATQPAKIGGPTYRLLDLPPWLLVGNIDDYRSNPYQICTITAGGVTESFFAWPPPMAKVTHRLDTQEVKGQDGARIVHTGIQPSRIPVKMLIWTGADTRRWDKFYPKVNPKLRPSGRILGKVSHPDLNQAQISSVYIYDVQVQHDADVRHAKTVTIEVMESRFTRADQAGTSKVPAVGIVMPNQFQMRASPVKEIRAAVEPPSSEVEPP